MAEERLQRRLAAILSADVVGYSRLMGLDEARTLSRLNALRRKVFDPTVAAHSGRDRRSPRRRDQAICSERDWNGRVDEQSNYRCRGDQFVQ
jgi:class 3 adenylate cyclase